MYGLAVFFDEARKAKGMTQHELATQAGMSPSGVSRTMSGELVPSPEAVAALAALLDVDEEYAEILAGLDTPSSRPRHQLALARNENRMLRERVSALELQLTLEGATA